MTEVTNPRTGDGYLTHQRVMDVYGACERPERNNPLKYVTVDAWAMRHTFSLKQLRKHREEIVRMVLCLPRGFRVDERGGGNIMMMVMRDDNTYWTNDMSVVERLMALGLASQVCSFCSPRGTWDKNPGGVPYFRVDITRFGVSVN